MEEKKRFESKNLVRFCSNYECRAIQIKKSTQNQRFHRFPRDPILCNEWLRNSGRLDLLKNKTYKTINNSIYRLCSSHFTNDQYCSPFGLRSKLKRNAVPTLFSTVTEDTKKYLPLQNLEMSSTSNMILPHLPFQIKQELSDDSTSSSQDFSVERKTEEDLFIFVNYEESVQESTSQVKLEPTDESAKSCISEDPLLELNEDIKTEEELLENNKVTKLQTSVTQVKLESTDEPAKSAISEDALFELNEDIKTEEELLEDIKVTELQASAMQEPKFTKPECTGKRSESLCPKYVSNSEVDNIGDKHDDLKSFVKIELFKCSQCKVCYTSKQCLSRHILSVHKNVKLFKCLECNYESCFKEYLLRHVKSAHFNLKPFQCSVCSSAFTLKTNLLRHIKKIHGNVKPFKCPSCEYTGSSKGELIYHLVLVHEQIKPCVYTV